MISQRIRTPCCPRYDLGCRGHGGYGTHAACGGAGGGYGGYNDQIGLYEISEPSLPISFTCTRRPRSSYQMSCEYRPFIS
jgi:hypothetical protein